MDGRGGQEWGVGPFPLGGRGGRAPSSSSQGQPGEGCECLDLHGRRGLVSDPTRKLIEERRAGQPLGMTGRSWFCWTTGFPGPGGFVVQTPEWEASVRTHVSSMDV